MVETAEIGIADSDLFFEMDDEADVENFTPTRRLKLQKVDITEPLCTTSEVKHCYADTVQQHLCELLNDSGPSCNQDQKEAIAKLLLANQDVLSTHEYDLS